MWSAVLVKLMKAVSCVDQKSYPEVKSNIGFVNATQSHFGCHKRLGCLGGIKLLS
jgi:hypothetical protein